MHDPFPLPIPGSLAKSIQPVADYLSLKTLPLHFHEVCFAFALYHVTHKYLAPTFSRFFFPRIYSSFNARTKLNWDVHIVSFVQSTLINILALWVMWKDDERRDVNWQIKVWGYTGAGGLIQGFAAGYFLWDLVITLQNMSVFGPGMLAHAVSALFVFSLGFRPFVNFYAPNFILYELSSPFLNIHWFCDKLNLTGSRIQLYNGILLLITFFSCRIVWGTLQSVRVFSNVYNALTQDHATLHDAELGKLNNGTTFDPRLLPESDIMRFAGDRVVPLWLAGCYLASNAVLNGLNWFWFGKMIDTIRKRFDPPLGTKKPQKMQVPEEEKVLVEGSDVATPGVELSEEAADYLAHKAVELDIYKASRFLEVQERSKVRSRAARGKDGRGLNVEAARAG